MRIFMTFVAVVALAAAPCAWDSDPREPPAIAAETGFADPDRMRRAFLRTLGQPPQTIRRNARESASAP
jgi:predicted outer membrane protein